MSEQKVVTRFAPSPTGFIHVGNIHTALYAWLWARKNNGIFILRIEDTDKKREVEGSIEHIKKSLRWLGLNWDQGPDVGGPHAPYLQSKRLSLYKKYADVLIKKSLAYADPYTEAEIEKWRFEAEENKKPFLYREYRPKNPPAWDGTKPLRFKISELKQTKWNDVVWGELSAGPEALDDFILIKSDGYPTYNFAHIVDDIEMGVTHVVRGQEFISSTPKFLALYEALDVKPPLFVTTPPIMGADGKKKLGKRDGAKDILDYEKEGYLPEAMFNFLAFMGWNPGGEKEIMTREEIISSFDINKIQKSGAQLNEEKLEWFNKEHIKKLPKEKIRKEIFKRLPTEMRKKELVPLILERIYKWGDIESVVEEFSYLFYNFGELDRDLITWKGLKDDQEKFEKTSEYLEKILELLDSVKTWDYESLKNIINDYAESVGKGNVLWPMRFALWRKEKTPDPFKLAELLGKSNTLERIKSAVRFLKGITKITFYTQDFFKDFPFEDLIKYAKTDKSTNNTEIPNLKNYDNTSTQNSVFTIKK